MNKYEYKLFIHLSSVTAVILVRVAVGPEPIPGTLGVRQEYTLHSIQGTMLAQNSDLRAIKEARPLIDRFLGGGRKLQSLEETHMNKGSM